MDIALVTYRELPDLHPDDHPLCDALRALDADVHAVCWDQPDVDWAGVDAVVLRSCWDYYLRFAEFRRWLDARERTGTRLWNPAPVVRWHYDKIYLTDLAGDGVELPGTEWLAPGETQPPNLGTVKPRVSASAHETWLTDRRRAAADQPRLARLVAAGGALIQEFVPEVMTAGELSLVYVAGAFSHAVRKRAGPGEFRVQERFGGWTEPASAGTAALEAGGRALARAPGPSRRSSSRARRRRPGASPGRSSPALDGTVAESHMGAHVGSPTAREVASMEQRIGFGMRLGALVLDCILVFVLSWLGAGTIGAMFGGTAASIAASSMAAADTTAVNMAVVGGIMGAVIGMVIAFAVIGTLYFLIEGFTGFTLGKLMLGIRIANADGTAASVPTLLGRYLIKNCYYVLSLLGVVTGVGALGTLGTVGGLIIFVGCFFTLGTAKQAFHDMIMKTAVYPKAAIKA